MENDESKNKSAADEYQLPEDDEFMFDELLDDDEAAASPQAGVASSQNQEADPLMDESQQDDPLSKLQEGLSGFGETAGGAVGGIWAGFRERLPMLGDKRVIIVGSILLVGVLVFAFMRPSGADKMMANTSAQPSLDHAMKKANAGDHSKSSKQATAPGAAPHAAAGSAQSDEDHGLSLADVGGHTQDNLSNEIDTVRSSEKGTQERLSTLENNLEEIQERLEQSNASQVRLAKQMDGVSSQLKEIQNVMAAKKKAEEAAKSAASAGSKVPPLSYRLRAIVHGRAWILGSDGSYFTVEKGSRLKGLKGKGNVVYAIDPARGEVLLRNGKVISFKER